MGPERYRRLRAVLNRRQPDLTVLMERVNKVHNFSAILRSCDAVGVLRAHAVLPERDMRLPSHTAAGSTKWVDVVEHPDVDRAVGALSDRGFQILAAHPGPHALDYRAVDLTRPTALMMGAELHGISDRGLELADGTVAIPMVGMVHSLNVSVAAAVLLFEAFRQRTAAGMYEESRIPGTERDRILFEWAYPRLAERFRSHGLPYPALDEDGGLVGRIPLSVRQRPPE